MSPTRKLLDTHIRIPPEDREVIARAAQLDSRPVSQWIRLIAVKVAKELIAKHESKENK